MDLFICSKCGANLIEFGITEVLVGAVVETDITFVGSGTSAKEAQRGNSDTHDFDDQWVLRLMRRGIA